MSKIEFDFNRFSVTIDIKCGMSNLTNAELAELAGVGASTLYAIKNGSKAPSMAEFCHLCDLFDLAPSKYFEGGK
jgi:transcriptional regulator with XRE-family HTH domain